MIAAGMIHLATIFAAVTFAAVRRCKWFSDIGSLQRVTEFMFWDETKGFRNIL
jgi:hypothetical protein